MLPSMIEYNKKMKVSGVLCFYEDYKKAETDTT